jgi:hypothetical protein
MPYYSNSTQRCITVEECSLLGCDAVLLLLRTDVSEEYIASVIRVKRISALGTTLAVNIILTMEAILSSETSVLTRATRRQIPENGILHSHRHENMKSYIAITGPSL